MSCCGGDTKCNNPSNRTQCANVKNYWIHKEFVDNYFYFKKISSDLAILELANSIPQTTTINVLPFNLYPRIEPCGAFVNIRTAIAIGCGLTSSSSKTLPSDLRTSNQTILTQSQGKAYFSNIFSTFGLSFSTVGDYFIYTETDSAEKPKGTICNGDSGGPLLLYNYDDNTFFIFGTVSFGNSDCSGYTGWCCLEKYLKFIADPTKNSYNNVGLTESIAVFQKNIKDCFDDNGECYDLLFILLFGRLKCLVIYIYKILFNLIVKLGIDCTLNAAPVPV